MTPTIFPSASLRVSTIFNDIISSEIIYFYIVF